MSEDITVVPPVLQHMLASEAMLLNCFDTCTSWSGLEPAATIEWFLAELTFANFGLNFCMGPGMHFPHRAKPAPENNKRGANFMTV